MSLVTLSDLACCQSFGLSGVQQGCYPCGHCEKQRPTTDTPCPHCGGSPVWAKCGGRICRPEDFGGSSGTGLGELVTTALEDNRRPLLLVGGLVAVLGAGWLALRASKAVSNPRRNVIYGGMGNVRCIRCKQLKDYDQMAQAPGAAVRDDRDGQYYGLCQDCHRDEEILRKVFAASPRTAARRSAKKGAKAAKKSSKAKARKRNDDKKPPSIAELMKQSYDRHAAVRGGSSR